MPARSYTVTVPIPTAGEVARALVYVAAALWLWGQAADRGFVPHLPDLRNGGAPAPGPRPSPAPEPAPAGSDPEAVSLGRAYGAALLSAVAAADEAASSRAFASTDELAASLRAEFSDRAREAYRPVAEYAEKKFGPTSPQPVAPEVADALRRFHKGVAAGVRGAAR